MKKVNAELMFPNTEEDSSLFTNGNGAIPVGSSVTFKVENQSQWIGDLSGVLQYQNGEFFINTINSGKLSINKGYDVYRNTIKILVPFL